MSVNKFSKWSEKMKDNYFMKLKEKEEKKKIE